jgi:mannose-6-phosphate isomerase
MRPVTRMMTSSGRRRLFGSSMESLVGPLLFEPYLRPQPWGARRLASQLGRTLPEGRYGESWELSAHPHHVSRVAAGREQGTPLTELWERYGASWSHADTPPATFPWLLKLLDCHELLSVQVHPNDDQARVWTPGQGGKSEAWLVLSAEPEAVIYAGLNAGVTPAEVEARALAGTVEACLHRFQPRPGDCIAIPPGVVHTMGGGVLLVEIQQTSDATFRLYDWNRPGLDGRPRPLQLVEALSCIDWNRGPVDPVTPQVTDELPAELGRVERLVTNEHFAWSRLTLTGKPCGFPADELTIWTVIEGTVTFRQGPREVTLPMGRSCLLPPATEPIRCSPDGPATLLRVQPGCTPS